MAKEKSKTPTGLSLAQKLNQMSFKDPIAFQGNISDKRKKKQSNTKIQGLQSLKNTLGRQNMRKQSDYRTNKI